MVLPRDTGPENPKVFVLKTIYELSFMTFLPPILPYLKDLNPWVLGSVLGVLYFLWVNLIERIDFDQALD